MHEYLPKILFVTPHAFNQVTGGGITFSNLFRGWPGDRLAAVHNDPEPTTTDVCDHYYVLGSKELDLCFPFDRLRRSFPAVPSTKTNHQSKSTRPSFLVRFLGLAKTVLLKITGSSLPERAQLTTKLEKWIAEYNPDVIYTILGSNGMMDLLEQIRVRFNLPVVVHIMDDWMATAHQNGIFANSLRTTMNHNISHFMDVSTRHLGISTAMCQAYETRYAKTFEPIQNTIETNRWNHVLQVKSQVKTPVDLLYVGSIFPDAQLTSLITCCQTVTKLNDTGFEITFTISSPSGHSHRYKELLEIHPSIRIIDTITNDEIFFKRIASADILLLPVNFDEQSVRFIRYSMPTKVPAYLTVGTPILVFGPQGVAQVDYARSAGWGYSVDENDIDLLQSALKELAKNSELRQSLSKTAKMIAQTRHDAKTVRNRFQQVLKEAIL